MLTGKQVAAILYLIYHSKDGVEASKQVLGLLVEKSMNLTKEVCFTLQEKREGYVADEIGIMARGVSSMFSENGTTHLDEILLAAGSELKFSHHYGDFDPSREGDPFCNDGQFAGHLQTQVARPGLVKEEMPLRYTFWLSREDYSRKAELLTVSRKEIEQINLSNVSPYDL